MEIQEQKGQKRTEGEEDLLNFDLDDLSLEDVDPATAGEEEVIDLTDLVEKGDVTAPEGEEEVVRLLGEEDGGGGTAGIELATKELAGLAGAPKEKGKAEAESLLNLDDFSLDFSEEEKGPEGEKSAEQEISDSDIAEILKEEGAEDPDLRTEEVVVSEDRLLEEVISDADLAAVEESLPTQELSAMLSPRPSEPGEMVLDLSEEAAEEPEPFSPPAGEKPGFAPESPAPEALDTVPVQAAGEVPSDRTTPVQISEERIEAIVTRVVQGVVEGAARETLEAVTVKVVRETLEPVTERVVRETVEAAAERLIRETVESVAEKTVRETLGPVAERMIRETLEPVAERVVRQTLMEATDRVITQAIDALKQSLESPSN